MLPARHSLDLLLVEDDAALRELLALHLGAQPGWVVRAVGGGDQALASCEESVPDIVVLDVMLPERSGLEVCSALRALYHPSPGVLMVTARADEVDIIVGFETGADDYVVKPCRPREVVARVKALARRIRPSTWGGAATAPAAPSTPSPPLRRGSLTVDVTARQVQVGERDVRLTATEFALLEVLAADPLRVHTRTQLLTSVFDTTHEGYARNVDCHVARLRRKLEAAGLLSPIVTVHGAGYRFASDG